LIPVEKTGEELNIHLGLSAQHTVYVADLSHPKVQWVECTKYLRGVLYFCFM